MNIKNVSLKNFEDVPDYVLEEVDKLTKEIGSLIHKKLVDSDPRIALSAMNRFHALLILSIVRQNKEDIEKLVQLELEVLKVNATLFSEVPIFEEGI